MTTPAPTTGKAIAAEPEIFHAWSYLIHKRALPDRRLKYSPELTEQLGDGRHVYTYDPAKADAVEADFQTVASMYTGDTSPLWTP